MEKKDLFRASGSDPDRKPDALIGVTVGNYRILEPIGEGGMGRVYLAEHPRIGKRVALKVLRRELAADPRQITRFVNEAKAVSAIGHRSIIDIFDFGELPDGRFYFSMEFLQGHDLEQWIRRSGRIPVPDATWIGMEICRALHAAHRRDIVHRDIKAENVFVCRTEDGEPFVKVLDFGIAKLAPGLEGSRVTQAGVVFGTPEYMAPEQARGSGTVDHRADIYSLGVLLYQMLTGRRPFDVAEPMDVIVKHLTQEPDPPTDHCPDLPAELESVVLRCLEKEPEDRFASAEELQTALAPFTGSLSPRSSGFLSARSVFPSTYDSGMMTSVPASIPGSSSRASVPGVPSLANGELAALGLPGRRSRMGTVVGVGVAVVALSALSFIVLTRWLGVQDAPGGVGKDTAAAAAPALAATPFPTADGTGTNPATEPPRRGTGIDDRSSAVALSIESDPPGASVYVDGESASRGRTPTTLRLPGDTETVRITLRRKGYEAASREVPTDVDGPVQFALLKEPDRGKTRVKGTEKKSRTREKEARGKPASSEDAVLKPSF